MSPLWHLVTQTQNKSMNNLNNNHKNLWVKYLAHTVVKPVQKEFLFNWEEGLIDHGNI